MKALIFDGRVQLDEDYASPTRKPGWSTIDIICAGICRTDLELSRGYMGYRGVLGHAR